METKLGSIDTETTSERVMSLENKISELIAAQSKFQADCAAAQSKLQADCATNSTRILEMTSIQKENIAASTINTAGLLEVRSWVNKSLDTLTSCTETSGVSQTLTRAT